MVCSDQHDGQVDPEYDPDRVTTAEGQGQGAYRGSEQPDSGTNFSNFFCRHFLDFFGQIFLNIFGRNFPIGNGPVRQPTDRQRKQPEEKTR